jgi:hypothetical protein
VIYFLLVLTAAAVAAVVKQQKRIGDLQVDVARIQRTNAALLQHHAAFGREYQRILTTDTPVAVSVEATAGSQRHIVVAFTFDILRIRGATMREIISELCATLRGMITNPELQLTIERDSPILQVILPTPREVAQPLESSEADPSPMGSQESLRDYINQLVTGSRLETARGRRQAIRDLHFMARGVPLPQPPDPSNRRERIVEI